MAYPKIFKISGVIGTVVCIWLFIAAPSWPTPDKLFVLLLFIFMIFGQALEALKRLGPFIGLILIYESFRSLAVSLNHYVNYTFMPTFDRALFGGNLPTKVLQNLLWRGSAQWYDLLFYIVYMLHFVLPVALAVLLWKKREKHYWNYITTLVTLSFMAFLTFLIFPAAPPWLASEKGYIEPIVHVSTYVFQALGIRDFPSFYNKISPNLVAAVPSLHTAYSVLLAFFVWKLFGKKWGLFSCIYPFIILISIVYMGEHYVFDLIAGVLYAALAYKCSPYILKYSQHLYQTITHKVQNLKLS